MTADLWRDQPTALTLNGQTMQCVKEYMYLSATTDHKLPLRPMVRWSLSKCHQQLSFLIKMRKFQVRSSVLQAFYRSFVESIVTFNITAWDGMMSATDLNPFNRIVKIEQEQEPLSSIHKKMIAKMATNSRTHTHTHTLHTYYNLMPSGWRYSSLLLRTRRATSRGIRTNKLTNNHRTHPWPDTDTQMDCSILCAHTHIHTYP